MKQQPSIKIYDIFDYYYLPFWQQGWFFGLIVLLIIMLLVGGIIWFLRRKKRKPHMPWDQALAKMRALKITDERYREFYDALTAILKEYLQQRYKKPIVGKTDLEVIELMQGMVDFPQILVPDIYRVFAGPQVIKFAGERALSAQMREDLERSISIIEQTKIKIAS